MACQTPEGAAGSTALRHTPGPWFYDDSMPYRIAINSERAHLATIPYLDRVSKANARLLAAAPELLAKLIECEAVLAGEGGHEGGSLLSEIRAAIAKAEGR